MSAEYTLYNTDSLLILASLVDKSIDVVVTDPPYGIGENNKKNISRGKNDSAKWRKQLARAVDYGDFEWDDKRVDEEYINEILRVSKEQVIWGGNYYTDYLRPSSSWAVWDKMNGTNDFADCELAWTSHKKAVRKFAYLWNGMIKQKPEKRYHPTQKPLDLMVWVLETYTKPNDLVLDPFMGSGTTGVACLMTGRRFIGCEIEPRYFKIAQERIELESRRPSLFELDVEQLSLVEKE